MKLFHTSVVNGNTALKFENEIHKASKSNLLRTESTFTFNANNNNNNSSNNTNNNNDDFANF